MPKKNSSWGENSKAVQAREHKANQKREEQEKRQKAKDDEYWRDDNKHDTRKKERKDNTEKKKQDALKRKQEAKKLLQEEEESNMGGNKNKAGSAKKVTVSEIDKIKEKERKQRELLAKEKEKEKKKLAENPEMEEENPNVKMAEILEIQGAVEARSLSDAIEVLDVGESESNDRHPEKRMKAAYLEYEARELPRLKAEFPNLRLSQLKQMLWKEWQKSPDNPMNQR